MPIVHVQCKKESLLVPSDQPLSLRGTILGFSTYGATISVLPPGFMAGITPPSWDEEVRARGGFFISVADSGEQAEVAVIGKEGMEAMGTIHSQAEALDLGECVDKDSFHIPGDAAIFAIAHESLDDSGLHYIGGFLIYCAFEREVQAIERPFRSHS